VSLLRGVWNDGQALTTPELQRPNDVGAGADDRLLEVLYPPGSNQKTIIPLLASFAATPLLIVPGVTNGTLKLQPCQLVAGDATNQQAIDLSVNLQAALQSALIASNSSGSTRVDLLYATISRTVPANIGSPPAGAAYAGLGVASTGTGAQQARSVKDVSSGIVTTQTINIYDVPTVTLTVLQGTPGSGAPSLPADSSTAFNFSLATISIATGYTSGTAINQAWVMATWLAAIMTAPSINVQSSVSSSSLPNATVPKGRICTDMVAIAGGSIHGSAGTPYSSYGIASITHSTGGWTIQLNSAASSGFVIATLANGSGGPGSWNINVTSSLSGGAFTVRITDSGTPADTDFNFIAFQSG
jgi:hypothetical protein